ncbi:sugar ABC transporter ATP-binding protein [Psychromonas sp. SA13A]|uniref:sugar ABC transporter ATP-binding protein n=1 Tax=Psychromonas sp. SA13A TaxID=2686346 RepID=UPI0014098564|nr:sugar ABC transporter ATP-binding protein [Psychromonas sp. SA13A]
MTILLSARNLTKKYGSLTALNNASLELRAGEVRSLVGANGAGKSTLIKILTGAIDANQGKVLLDGVPLKLGDPTTMLEAGIGCIYQHSNLVPALSVLDNIYLGRQPVLSFSRLDRKKQRAEAEELLLKYSLKLDLDAIVSTLPTVRQKEVEIAKALALNAKVLLMDEPTAWLSHTEVNNLFTTVRNLQASGVGIIYISHMLDELYAICDSVTILRDGNIVEDCAISDLTRQELLEKFIGKTLAQAATKTNQHAQKEHVPEDVILRCENLSKKGEFDDISFDLAKGEILCITGLIGSKRTELMHTIFGSNSLDSGRIFLEGAEYENRSPANAIKHQIGFVPEDRHRDGLMMQANIQDNLLMVSHDKIAKFGIVNQIKVDQRVSKQIKQLNITPADPNKIVSKLSGGNQQKVLIGKWLELHPKVLILDEPTVGVDVGAKSEIYTLIRKLRDQGTAIIVVSSDMEEVMGIADRIMVMCSGKKQGIYNAASISQQKIIAYVGGEAQS